MITYFKNVKLFLPIIMIALFFVWGTGFKKVSSASVTSQDGRSCTYASNAGKHLLFVSYSIQNPDTLIQASDKNVLTLPYNPRSTSLNTDKTGNTCTLGRYQNGRPAESGTCEGGRTSVIVRTMINRITGLP